MDLRIFTEPQNGATYDDQLAVARLAEELGFDAFFRSDHYLAMTPDPGPGPTDSWVTLGALARETSRIRLGTLVTSATFRHPGPLAVSVAQVDAMSGGRVELGVGAGWFEAEHKAYAIPFPDLGERFARLTEQLQIVTGLWRTPPGETYAFRGRYYSVTDSPALPKPVQDGGPPVIVGGWGSRRTPRLAARFAAEFNVPFAPLHEFAPSRARVIEACEEIDRDPATMRFSLAITTCCGADEAEVEQRAKAIGHPVDHLRDNALAGTPDEVVERLQVYRDAGCERVYLQILDLKDLDHLRLLAAEVAPHLTEMRRDPQHAS